MTEKRRSPQLFEFFAAYFHEDWTLDDQGPDDVIARFKSDSSPAVVAECRAEIVNLLSLNLDETALAAVLFRELGCYYRPVADSLSGSSWLLHVRERLDRA